MSVKKFKIERLEERIAPGRVLSCGGSGSKGHSKGGSKGHSKGGSKGHSGKGNNGYGNGGHDGSPNGKQDCTR
jgi:hypothetical protein